MAIYELLSNYAAFDGKCSYNGRLKDYIREYPDEKYIDIFSDISKINDEVCLYKDYPLKIDLNASTNKRIGYRDITKIGEEFATVPYILYWEIGNSQRAIILSEHSIIEARGMFYCLTGKGCAFENAIDEIMSLDINNEELVDCFLKLQKTNCNPSTLQKKTERNFLADPEQLKEQCIDSSEEMLNDVKEIIPQLSEEEKSLLIKTTILRIYLMKKTLYVKYMANRKILTDRHCGNIKEQRIFAKSYADDIPFISFHDLWNTK